MTVTGKALTREFFGKAPRYAYFNGCSTGGRQGLSEAQRYPGQKTSAFIRLFMAPGVGHCSGGTGPAPRDPLEALVAWVEQDRAPETLSAVRRDETGKVVRSRPLCQYPLVARYKGHGSTDEASSFECRAGF